MTIPNDHLRAGPDHGVVAEAGEKCPCCATGVEARPEAFDENGEPVSQMDLRWQVRPQTMIQSRFTSIYRPNSETFISDTLLCIDTHGVDENSRANTGDSTMSTPQTMKIQNGMYKVGEKEATRSRYPDKEVYVVRGDVVNDGKRRGLSNFAGVNSSKWYLYLEAEHLRHYADGSGTGVIHVGEIRSVHDTKGEAVETAQRLIG